MCEEISDSTAKHIESILYSICDAINDRMFDHTAFPWTHIADPFEGEMADIGDVVSVSRCSREEYVELCRQRITYQPNFRMAYSSMVVHFSGGGHRAKVFANIVMDGLAPNVQIPGFGVTQFRWDGSMWLLTQYASMRQPSHED